MTPSDFLTILGLSIAAWAIIAANERRFISLFFSKGELFAGLLIILFIHYLMAFDWLRVHWFGGLAVFMGQKGVPAGVWAYLCSLGLLSYAAGRVSFGFFSESRLPKLIELYESLLERGDLDILIRYLLKYHVQDVQRYLESETDEDNEGVNEASRKGRRLAGGRDAKWVGSKRARFAGSVYDGIITKEEFVRRAAGVSPRLFATVIKGMQSKRAANRDFVKGYVGSLFEHRNEQFVKELKSVNGANDSIVDRVKHTDLPILEATLANTEVAAENYVWFPIGEQAKKSLEYDREQRIFLKLPYDEKLESELWQQKGYIAIVYFNVMVRESIYRDSGWHMWLFYYQRFAVLLIENNALEVFRPGEKRAKTFNQHLIGEIIDNLLGWFELAVELDTEGLSMDAAKCLGEILVDVAEYGEYVLDREFKVAIFGTVLNTYFGLSKHQHVATQRWTREQLEGMFVNPRNPEWEEPAYSENYRAILEAAWEAFDKVPYRGFENNGSIEQFTKNVLDRMAIKK